MVTARLNLSRACPSVVQPLEGSQHTDSSSVMNGVVRLCLAFATPLQLALPSPSFFFLLYLFNVKRGLQPATLAVGLRWSDYEDRLECGMAFLCGLLRCEILFIQLAMRVARSVVTCRAARLSSFYGAADSLTRLELVHSAP